MILLPGTCLYIWYIGIVLSTARIYANYFDIVQLWAILYECLQIEVIISIDIDGVHFFVFKDGVAYIQYQYKRARMLWSLRLSPNLAKIVLIHFLFQFFVGSIDKFNYLILVEAHRLKVRASYD